MINEVPTTSKTYSSILAAYDKSLTLTNAEYLGQFNEHGEYIEDLTTTEYLDINVNVNANVFNSMKAHSLSNEENT